MKRFYLLPLLGLICIPVHAKNKISMVTYFPVPYVAYSQVNATESMDIGLTTACDMKLGCTESDTTLNVTKKVNLERGRLNLNGGRGILGSNLELGSGTNTGEISFQNVRINTGTMESVNATDTKTDTLNLFGKAFPSCKDANSTSNGQMRWASLKLKGASKNELYLVCGESLIVASDCSDPNYKSAHKDECCPSMPESDEVCYMDCSDSETWEWSSATSTVEQFLGSDWQKRALRVGGGSNTSCPVPERGAPNWLAYGVTVRGELLNTHEPELRSWDIWALADSMGSSRLETIIAASTLNRQLCEEKMPCKPINENIFCLVLFAEAKLHWCYMGGSSAFDTDLYLSDNYRLWECKQVSGEEKRCKNGW